MIRLLALVSALAAMSGVAEAVELQFLSSWDDRALERRNSGNGLVKAVEEAGSDLSLNIQGPETVPAFEQLEPVRAGAFQLLVTHGAYHYGTTGIGVILDAMEGDPQVRHDSGVFDAVDQAYQKDLGLKLIAMPASNTRGYQIILRRKPNEDGTLNGFKVRATPTYFPIMKLLGASTVNMPPGEIYTSLEKGVIDGTTWPSVGPLDWKWYEVADYMLRPTFGVTSHLVLMNLDAWNGLSDEHKKILLDAGRKVENDFYTQFDDLSLREEEALIGHGMKTANLPENLQKELWKTWADGLWGLGLEKSPDTVAHIREVAEKANITP